MILHPDIGIVNVTLSLLGIKGPDWLGDPDTVLLTLAFIFIWKQVGYNMILFVAGLKTIPNDLYQAAAIDGVDNAFERFRIVTWPLLAPTMIFVVVVTTLLSFQGIRYRCGIDPGRTGQRIERFALQSVHGSLRLLSHRLCRRHGFGVSGNDTVSDTASSEILRAQSALPMKRLFPLSAGQVARLVVLSLGGVIVLLPF